MRNAGTCALLCAAVCTPAFAALPPEDGASAGQAPSFKASIDLVQIGVTVTSRKGELITDLEPEDFEIFEDGKKQTLSYFAPGLGGDGQGPPLHLGLLLDVSQSMGEAMSFTKTAAVKFLNTLTDAVDITVVNFDTEVRVARYSQNEFVRAIERIREQKAVGYTALNDAIGVYLDGAAELDGRKIMLIYTDGSDTTSALPFHELIELAKASDVTIYPIGALEYLPQSARMDARRTLNLLAATTGGQAFFPMAVKELDQIYEKVLAEIRAQYTIGYVSTNPATDGAWRDVEVKIAGKPAGQYRLRARRGYYAPYKTP
jgi:Ca-activated chloride channel homolog